MKHLNRLFILMAVLFAANAYGQSCDSLTATLNIIESRCTATGAIEIKPLSGSGNYKYKISGPINSNFTSSNYISGLSAGTYTVLIHDITKNCEISFDSVVVPGSYEDPRFTLTSQPVSCDNGSNGSINLLNLQHGRAPFAFAIVAPSADSVGISNPTASFNNLRAGDYRVQLSDSCGGIQTRTISIDNYTWNISGFSLEKFSCDSAAGFIQIIDSKGNDSKIKPIDGITYGLAIPGADTVWQQTPEFRTQVLATGKVFLLAKDACGKIKSAETTLAFTPSLSSKVNIVNKVCDSYSASVTDIKNFKNPVFSLYRNNILVEENETGSFTNLEYDNDYCIKAYDECSDTTITRCFNTPPPPISVAENVKISNYTCNTFNAAITGQTNLTNAFYILLDSDSKFLDLNYTGKFDQLTYGNYCIMIRDGCRDTAITRCFTVKQQQPGVDSVLTPSYVTCDYFGITVGGVNLTSPTFCLIADTGKVECNTTGRFDTIPLGTYTITVHDACTDTTITRYIDVDTPTLKNDVRVSISNKTCTTFTATLSTKDFKGGSFSLFKADDVLVESNNSGRFANLPYGSYYLYSRAVCPDTTVKSSFKAAPDIPSVSASVSISNKTCGTFAASITGQKYLTNPVYQLTDKNKNTIDSNNTGKFTNIPYGAYCIKILNGCYDTVITRCFISDPNPFNYTVTPQKSCNYGFAKVTVNLNGNFPVNVKIYSPANELLHDQSYTQTSVTVDNLPGLDDDAEYKIVAVDACGNEKVTKFRPVVSYLNHSVTVENKCPGSKWENGYGNITATVSSNAGALIVRIIKKDAQSINTAPQIISHGKYTFTNLGPATYVLRYYANDACSRYFYDTIKVTPYDYPGLSKSSAFKCDENGYSVGAVVTNGIGPFTYSIIGSYPDAPSIIAGPQAEPVFNVNNGTDYSLVRLRALDACGNATLGDANILPLAQNYIRTNFNCFGHPATLTLDTVYNTSVSWYKKDSVTASDSMYMGAGFRLHLPEITPKDTGIYVAHASINYGCVQRVYNIRVNGDCYSILPVTVSDFAGRAQEEGVVLDWNLSNASDLKTMVIERNTGNGFREIGKELPKNVSNLVHYSFVDTNPEASNFYRIKFVNADGTSTYSNIIHIKFTSNKAITVYPNPVSEVINISFQKPDSHEYRISVTNTVGQILKEVAHRNTGGVLKMHRTPDMVPGFYFISVIDTQTQMEYREKLILK